MSTESIEERLAVLEQRLAAAELTATRAQDSTRTPSARRRDPWNSIPELPLDIES